uniref:Uncharacterized protein n=1 Tax=Daphnia magna TaxID=35525 RepID=A0A0P6CLD6_9CRUS
MLKVSNQRVKFISEGKSPCTAIHFIAHINCRLLGSTTVRVLIVLLRRVYNKFLGTSVLFQHVKFQYSFSFNTHPC